MIILKKKLLLIVPSLRGGGAEKVIGNIAAYIDKNKFEVILLALDYTGPYMNLIPKDVDVIDLKESRVSRALFKLKIEIDRANPDIILSTLTHLNLGLLCIKPFLKSKAKIIIREANTPLRSLEQLSLGKKAIFKLMYRFLYGKADFVVAQCNEMKEDILKCSCISPKKIKYIYNPVDLNKIREKKSEFNPYNNEYINLVTVGRLTYQKGFDQLIKAFKIVNDKKTNTHLTILGEGELEEYLKEISKKLNIENKITFAKFNDNPYPYYNYSDIYVLSSRWEGFPNVLLEALGCGTKVVATKCKSGPSEILGDNKYGILVEENDIEALANGILDYLHQENKTGVRANDFDVRAIVKQYEELFLNIEKNRGEDF